MADRPSQRVWELVYDYIGRNIIPTMTQEAINEILNDRADITNAEANTDAVKKDRITMTVSEVAKYIGVCKDTIYSMVREDKIPYARARSRILFRQKAIDAWMTEQEEQNRTTGSL